MKTLKGWVIILLFFIALFTFGILGARYNLQQAAHESELVSVGEIVVWSENFGIFETTECLKEVHLLPFGDIQKGTESRLAYYLKNTMNKTARNILAVIDFDDPYLDFEYHVRFVIQFPGGNNTLGINEVKQVEFILSVAASCPSGHFECGLYIDFESKFQQFP